MPIIQGKNITKTFGTGNLETRVLRGIDVTIETGEFVAIMGKSGAGKSTLLYQLSALDRPTGGSITIDSSDILQLSETELVKFRLNTLGYIFQDYALIPDLTAEENVLLPLLMKGVNWQRASEIARETLDTVGIPGKYKNLPSQLSGGEQQRVSVARAVAGKPKIIFADEPTANLDSASGRAVIELLAKLHHEGQTIVMVTHEPEYINHCNRVIYLEDGLVTHERALANFPKEVVPENVAYVNPVYTTIDQLQKHNS
jgi:putative ABC transport system ATP-binding protein